MNIRSLTDIQSSIQINCNNNNINNNNSDYHHLMLARPAVEAEGSTRHRR